MSPTRAAASIVPRGAGIFNSCRDFARNDSSGRRTREENKGVPARCYVIRRVEQGIPTEFPLDADSPDSCFVSTKSPDPFDPDPLIPPFSINRESAPVRRIVRRSVSIGTTHIDRSKSYATHISPAIPRYNSGSRCHEVVRDCWPFPLVFHRLGSLALPSSSLGDL